MTTVIPGPVGDSGAPTFLPAGALPRRLVRALVVAGAGDAEASRRRRAAQAQAEGVQRRRAGRRAAANKLLSRISVDPNICFGKPCIRGHRIGMSLILDLLASGMSVREIMDEYSIEEADVLACIAYGAERSRFVGCSGYRSRTSSFRDGLDLFCFPVAPSLGYAVNEP